jgi:hypothetical protein
MNVRKHIRKNERVGLRLTKTERKLVLDGVTNLPDEIEQTIQSTSPNQPIMLTLDDWDELAGHIASEANDTGDKTLQKKLDTILLKIQDVLETHIEEEPRGSLTLTDSRKDKPFAWESVKLAELAARFLVRAERLGIKSKPVAGFPLPRAERAVLTKTPIISAKLQEKLAAANPKLTVGEVGGLLIAVSEALIDAPRLHQVALSKTALSLLKCLRSELAA